MRTTFLLRGQADRTHFPGHQLVFSRSETRPRMSTTRSTPPGSPEHAQGEAAQPHSVLQRRGRACDLARSAGGPPLARRAQPTAADAPSNLDISGGEFRQGGELRRPRPSHQRGSLRARLSRRTNREDHFLAARDQVRGAGTVSWKTGRLDHELMLGGGWRRSNTRALCIFPGRLQARFWTATAMC
jgi:hypothetical protein